MVIANLDLIMGWCALDPGMRGLVNCAFWASVMSSFLISTCSLALSSFSLSSALLASRSLAVFFCSVWALVQKAHAIISADNSKCFIIISSLFLKNESFIFVIIAFGLCVGRDSHICIAIVGIVDAGEALSLFIADVL